MLSLLLKTQQTVFTVAALQEIFPDLQHSSLAQNLYRYKKAGKLLNPHKGIRTLPVYDHHELACKLYP